MQKSCMVRWRKGHEQGNRFGYAVLHRRKVKIGFVVCFICRTIIKIWHQAKKAAMQEISINCCSRNCYIAVHWFIHSSTTSGDLFYHAWLSVQNNLALMPPRTMTKTIYLTAGGSSNFVLFSTFGMNIEPMRARGTAPTSMRIYAPESTLPAAGRNAKLAK